MMETILINKMIKSKINSYIKNIEKELKSDVFYYNGEFIFSIANTYFIDRVREIKDKNTGCNTITIILTTNGGSHQAVQYIVEQIREKIGYTKINVIVPMFAYSAGTLFCFGANKLFLGKGANIGPLDVQLYNGNNGFVSVSAIMKDYRRIVVRQMEAKKKEETNNFLDYEKELLSEEGQYNVNYIAYLIELQDSLARLATEYLSTYMFGYNKDTEDRENKILKIRNVVNSFCSPYYNNVIKPIFNHNDRIYIHDLERVNKETKINIPFTEYHKIGNEAFNVSSDIDNLNSLIFEYLYLNKKNIGIAGTGGLFDSCFENPKQFHTGLKIKQVNNEKIEKSLKELIHGENFDNDFWDRIPE